MSSLAWLDYSEGERQRMLDVIALFREQGIQDELGIGAVRDAFADLLFPGTSTIQTRARYFFFIPWIYLALEEARTPSARVGTAAREREVALAVVLARSDDRVGAIGRLAGRELERLPSNIYWQGLRRCGIRIFDGSQPEYHRSLDAFYPAQRRPRNDDREPVDGRVPRNWHAGLPRPPGGFPDGHRSVCAASRRPTCVSGC